MIETKPRVHYVLRDGMPCIEPDPIAWALWMETGDPHVDRTEIGPRCYVATYLRDVELDAAETPQDFFETRVYGGPLHGSTRRYETLGDAKAGHWDLVDLTRKRSTLGERIRRFVGIHREDCEETRAVPYHALPMSGY